ncbi:MAG TPA: hypothetical protein VGG39_26850 [Polyangiaceae bacterium]|jgi:hypothetical protein
MTITNEVLDWATPKAAIDAVIAAYPIDIWGARTLSSLLAQFGTLYDAAGAWRYFYDPSLPPSSWGLTVWYGGYLSNSAQMTALLIRQAGIALAAAAATGVGFFGPKPADLQIGWPYGLDHT